MWCKKVALSNRMWYNSKMEARFRKTPDGWGKAQPNGTTHNNVRT